VNRSLLSGRSQRRLVELQRAANSAVQELNKHHGLLLGALLGCDVGTQRIMLDEYRERSVRAHEALLKLGSFLDHCRISHETAEQA
jgi:hypothetical protein